MTWLLAARAFLKRIPWQVWAGIALIAAVLFYGSHREAQGYADAEAVWKPRVQAEKDAHAATKRAYREAQEEAARIQAEVIAAEIERQEGITANVRKDYQQRLAALRARADRLRAEARAGADGASGEVRMPAESETSGRADAAPDCQRFPAPDLETDLACREIATAQAIQLDALITWVREQTGN